MRVPCGSRDTGPAPHSPSGARGFMGVHPISPHGCGFGEAVQLCPSVHLMGGAPGVWSPGSSVKGRVVPVELEQESASHCWQ